MKVKRPLSNGKIRSVCRSAAYFISFLIRVSQKRHSGTPHLLGHLGQVVDVLVTFDADFSQAWVDGQIYEGLDHTDALRRAKCPMLLLHANWVRHPDYGLVGAMDDDAARARTLAPEMQYRRIDSDHVIHNHNPDLYIDAIREFILKLN